MKTKRLYQSPLIRRDEVELEDGFCVSIIMGDDKSGANTSAHETGFDNRNHNNASNWDSGFTASGWE